MPTDYQNILTDLVKRIRPLLVNVALGTCRVIEQATGWYISAGSTNARYLEHGANTVASFGGTSDHTIGANADGNFVHGEGHTLSNQADDNYVFGLNHDIDDQNLSLVFGDGVKIPDASGNTHYGTFRFGYQYDAVGDNHVSILRGMNSTTITSSWLTFMSYPIPTDTVWYFHAKIVVQTQGVAQTEIFTVEGAIENDGGTTALLASTTTNVYRDTATAECQAAADDTNDLILFQLRETASNNRTYKMHFRVDTSELTFAA
jgi:hypothetical protein